MVKLNDEQTRVANQILATRENYFITGSGGTGKSILLKDLYKNLSDIYGTGKVALTATTGIAAINIDGITIHSFAGLGHDGNRRPNQYTLKRWGNTKVLIIDEVSMLTAEFLEKIYKYIILYNIQVLCFGDFFQLPPVNSEPPFTSPKWSKLKLDVNTLELKTIMRQQDKEFIKVLNEIRIGEITEESIKYLKKLDISEQTELDKNATKIYMINKGVDAENYRRLKELDTKIHVFTSTDVITKNKKKILSSTDPLLTKMIQKEASGKIELKIGARVMLTRNKPPDYTIVNGSVGTLIDINSDIPTVKFILKNGTEYITDITPVDYEVKYRDYKFTRKQIPLKLAWAVSAHKAQGITLQNSLLFLEGAFETGQIYTGVSRVTSPNGLVVDDIDTLIHKNKVCKKAKEYYKKFTTVSM